jgi:peptide deformylase
MLSIVTLPEPNLRKPSSTVDQEFLLREETQQFIDEMIPAMYKTKGIGLAAPQAAKNICICIVGKEADESLKNDLILVNPVWMKNSRKTHTDSEGCLSVPKKFGNVKRYTDIHVKAMDRHGKPLSFDAKDFFARVIQHEADHLNGSLFIDKATGLYTAE